MCIRITHVCAAGFNEGYCFAQISISLLMARFITTFLWKQGFDPDMYALPCQSALTDLVGQLLLVACYEVASLAR